MSNDPVGFRDIHSFNRYAYANNNPYKYVDPDGGNPLAILGAVVGGIGGAISSRISNGNWDNAVRDGAIGATLGGIAGLTMGASLLSESALAVSIEATSVRNIAAHVLTGSSSAAIGDAVGQFSGYGEVKSPGSVISSAIIGGVTAPYGALMLGNPLLQAVIPETMNLFATPIRDEMGKKIDKKNNKKSMLKPVPPRAPDSARRIGVEHEVKQYGM